MRQSVYVLVGVVLLAGCGPEPDVQGVGSTYGWSARPEVWKVLPRGQAEEIGLQPGDVLLSYNGEPVASNDAVREAQVRAQGQANLQIVVLRGDAEVVFGVEPGPLGVLPLAGRYPSSLALALEAVLRRHGAMADYDWLAALSAESFSFTANDDVCRAWWPGGRSEALLADLGRAVGLTFRELPGIRTGDDPVAAIRGELMKGNDVIALGGWPGQRPGFWGVVTRFDRGTGLLYGHTTDAVNELPLSRGIEAAYVVRLRGSWAEPAELLRQVLTQSIELCRQTTETSWLSGFQAYDELIASLDSVPFCPICGPAESQACFDRLVWTAIAHRESAIRFLEAMRLALPDQVAVIDDLISDHTAVLGKLEGIAQSGTRIGTVAGQQKLARVFAAIEVIENDLLGVYEDLLKGL